MELNAMDKSKFVPKKGGNAPKNSPREKLTPELKEELIKQGRCFYCRNPGHLAINCPTRPKQPAPNEKGQSR